MQKGPTDAIRLQLEAVRLTGITVSAYAPVSMLTMRCLLVLAAAWLHLMCYAAWWTGYALWMLQARLLTFCFLLMAGPAGSCFSSRGNAGSHNKLDTVLTTVHNLLCEPALTLHIVHFKQSQHEKGSIR